MTPSQPSPTRAETRRCLARVCGATEPGTAGSGPRPGKRGVTLIEIMVVACCSLLILTPLLTVYRSGTRSSLRGMLQMEIAGEAMTALRQIRRDLRHACFVQPLTPFEIRFPNLVAVGGTTLSPVYSFLSFPQAGTEEDAVPATPTGPALRRASRVSYILQRGPAGTEIGVLWRQERFHPDHPLARTYPGGVQNRVVCRHVCGFVIEPVMADSGPVTANLFWIRLKLAGSVIPADTAGPAVPDPKSPGEYLRRRAQGLVLADYHDVVVPDVFRSIWQHPGFRRNIHSGISDRVLND